MHLLHALFFLLLLTTSLSPIASHQPLPPRRTVVISSVNIHLREPGVLDVSFEIHDTIKQVVAFTGLQLSMPLVLDGHVSTTYSMTRRDGTWAVVTLKRNDELVGVFMPYPGIEYAFSASRAIPNATITLHDDTDQHGGCTVGIPPHHHHTKPEQQLQKGTRWETYSTRQYLHQRKLILEPWIGTCFPQDLTARKMEIGIVVDEAWVSRAALENTTPLKMIETTVASASAIYSSQMNMELQVTQVVLPDNSYAPSYSAAQRVNTCVSAASVDPNLPLEEMSCCSDKLFLSDRLIGLANWAKQLPVLSTDPNQPTRKAHWAGFSDCHPAPGFVGRTYIGTLCASQYNVGITSFGNTVTTYTWRIFAHEIGHAFNAQHAFQNGIGTTGGIMDYGDGLWNGTYQFDPLRKPEMCPHITSQVDSCIYFSPAQSTCGDMVVDYAAGEECECPVRGQTQCNKCVQCQLTTGAECAPVAGNVCCHKDGTFVSSTTQCTQQGIIATGICVMGTCQVNVCPEEFDLGVCAAVESNGCAVRCGTSGGGCGSTKFNVPDGVQCGAPLAAGVCASGSCMVQPNQQRLTTSRLPHHKGVLKTTTTSTPTLSTSQDNPSWGACEDLVTPWWDGDGATYTCEWYGSNYGMCDQYGHEYRNFGYTAVQACCACGGGVICPGPSDAVTCYAKSSEVCGRDGEICTWCDVQQVCMAGNNILGCANPGKFYGKCLYAAVVSGSTGNGMTTGSPTAFAPTQQSVSPSIVATQTPSLSSLSAGMVAKCARRKSAIQCASQQGCLWCKGTCLVAGSSCG